MKIDEQLEALLRAIGEQHATFGRIFPLGGDVRQLLGGISSKHLGDLLRELEKKEFLSHIRAKKIAGRVFWFARLTLNGRRELERLNGKTPAKVHEPVQHLPRELLHPEILRASEPGFAAGNFDTAVLDAFREIEIRVRDACGLSDGHGVVLMRSAFASGNLRLPGIKPAEQESLGPLFAGAFGLYGNSTRHRRVGLSATQCIEILVMTSHLLGIVERCERAPDPK